MVAPRGHANRNQTTTISKPGGKNKATSLPAGDLRAPPETQNKHQGFSSDFPHDNPCCFTQSLPPSSDGGLGVAIEIAALRFVDGATRPRSWPVEKGLIPATQCSFVSSQAIENRWEATLGHLSFGWWGLQGDVLPCIIGAITAYRAPPSGLQG